MTYFFQLVLIGKSNEKGLWLIIDENISKNSLGNRHEKNTIVEKWAKFLEQGKKGDIMRGALGIEKMPWAS